MAVPGKRLTKLWAVIVYVLLFAYAQAEDAPAIGFVNMSILLDSAPQAKQASEKNLRL